VDTTIISEKAEESDLLNKKPPSSPVKEELSESDLRSPSPQTVVEDETLISDTDTVVEDQLSPAKEEKALFIPETSLPVESTIEDSSFLSPASNDETLVSDTPVIKLEEVKPEYAQSVSSFDEPEQHRPRVSLTALLLQADELYARFPPSTPELCLSSILGPSSVIFTWSESPLGGSLSESDAEAIVDKPETIVLPYVEPEDQPPEKKENAVRRGRILRTIIFGKTRLGRRTMLAGAVLVLGIAIAAHGLSPASGDTHRVDFRRLARWLVELHFRRFFK